jgi:cytochrome P450
LLTVSLAPEKVQSLSAAEPNLRHDAGVSEFVLRGAATWRDPFRDYAELRSAAAVHDVTHPRWGRFFVLPRFPEVFAAVRDTERFSSAAGLTLDPAMMSMFDGFARPIVMMDPPDHTAMRRLVSRPLTPRAVAALDGAITQFVDERLDGLRADEVDICELLFKPLPSWVVAHFLGVPLSDRERFDRWTDAIVAANAAGDLRSAPTAALELFTYAEYLIATKRERPGDDLVSDLAGLGEAVVSTQWIIGFIFTMVAGGNDTTTGLLGGAAELLCTFRAQRELLINQPALISASIEEFLRLTSPVQNLVRTTTCEVDIGGVIIPEGHKVVLVYGSANRDDGEFGETAGELDVRRHFGRHLALGYGAHHCLGASAARRTAAIALERLLCRFPNFTVDAERGTFADGMFIRRYQTLPLLARG